ncbi:MAG: hypothetical protein HYV16_13360 [Gammaproteobacteria bacterium]|nr:hypothetical protein [Gammaproteobacteria bacterium]
MHAKTKTLIAVALSCAGINAAQAANELFVSGKAGARSAKDQNILAQHQADAKVTAMALTRLSPTLLSAKPKELNLNLLPGVSLLARQTRVEKAADGSTIWYGKIALNQLTRAADVAGDDNAILVEQAGLITGNVRANGELYAIRPLSNGEHVVMRIDQNRMPADHPASYATLFSKAAPIPSGEVTAAAVTTQRILVAYTPAVAAKHGNMGSFINLAIAETNQGYGNSGVNITAELAASVQVSYTETGNFDTDLSRFRGTSDGYMDNIHTLRDQNAADLNMLMVTNDAYCGLASAIGATATTAFAEVFDDCATGYYSFAHELGHLQSARHDPSNDPTRKPYAYGHGYQASNKAWRTVMAYNCSGAGCPRINYWSNPNKTYSDGQTMGTTTKSDNARVLNTTAGTVAGFR